MAFVVIARLLILALNQFPLQRQSFSEVGKIAFKNRTLSVGDCLSAAAAITIERIPIDFSPYNLCTVGLSSSISLKANEGWKAQEFLAKSTCAKCSEEFLIGIFYISKQNLEFSRVSIFAPSA